MITNEGYIDGSWKLKVVSEDLNGVIVLTVYNNTNFGEVINKISQHFNMDRKEIKDFICWCPSKNKWLLKTELTLHQLSLNANTTIFYMKKIRPINIQLTNKETHKFFVDFSVPALKVMKNLSVDIGIDNFYSFSLLRYRKYHDAFSTVKPKSLMNKLISSPLTASLKNLVLTYSSNKRISRNMGSNCPWTPTSGYGSLSSTVNSLENYHGSCFSINNYTNNNSNFNEIINERYSYFPNNHILDYHDNMNRTKFNKDWIILSKSLMEQNITEHWVMKLKMKSFVLCFDEEQISEKLLNLYYEHMKNAILTGEIEVEMYYALILASLQYHIMLSEKEITKSNGNTASHTKTEHEISLDEEINRILLNLEKELLMNPNNLENDEKLTFRIDYFVRIRQIQPLKASEKYIRMKLKLIKDQVKIFKENNLSKAKYEFNINSCRFQVTCGAKPTDNIILWSFEYCKKLIKIETRFFSDEDFIAIYVCSVSHSNLWYPSSKQYSDCEKSAKIILKTFRSSEVSEYNIFNMPRIELIELLGCRIGKKESSGKYLKIILKNSCSFRNMTSRQGKIQYLRFCMNIPRYNYHYFLVHILQPLDNIGATVVAINEEMFMIFDSETHLIKRYVFPWKSLKSWNINTELNKLELYFHKQFISFTTSNCPAICFHEFMSAFIWFASSSKTMDKVEQLNELLNLINMKNW